MIEISIVDFVLLVWAGLATSLALHFYDKERDHKRFVEALIENKNLRKDFFETMDTKFKEEA